MSLLYRAPSPGGKSRCSGGAVSCSGSSGSGSALGPGCRTRPMSCCLALCVMRARIDSRLQYLGEQATCQLP